MLILDLKITNSIKIDEEFCGNKFITTRLQVLKDIVAKTIKLSKLASERRMTHSISVKLST